MHILALHPCPLDLISSEDLATSTTSFKEPPIDSMCAGSAPWKCGGSHDLGRSGSPVQTLISASSRVQCSTTRQRAPGQIPHPREAVSRTRAPCREETARALLCMFFSIGVLPAELVLRPKSSATDVSRQLLQTSLTWCAWPGEQLQTRLGHRDLGQDFRRRGYLPQVR